MTCVVAGMVYMIVVLAVAARIAWMTGRTAMRGDDR